MLSALGVALAAAFGAGASWNNLDRRVSTLEKTTKELKTPQSARAQICLDLMKEWISQVGSSLPNGVDKIDAKTQAYKCEQLASFRTDADNAVEPTNALQQ